MKIKSDSWWGSLFSDRVFFTTLLQLAVPIALQNLLVNSLSFADTVMIGQLGEISIAAVGLGNQIFFMFILILFGIGSGSGIFVAQYWGKKDIPNIRRTQGLCLSLALLVGLLFTLASFLVPRFLLELFTRDPEVIRLGSVYLRIVAVSYLFSSLSFSYSIVLRSVEQARLPLYVTMVSLGANIVLNYIFIFGFMKIPAMGVAGAALGTLISRGLELAIMLLLIYRKGYQPADSPNAFRFPAAAKMGEMLGFSRAFTARYFKTALPVILNEMAWGAGMTAYKAVYGRVGTDALASVNIAETVISLMFVLFIGSGNAAAAMIGKTIGEGDRTRTYDYARRFAVFSPLLGILVSLFLLAVAGPVVSLFNVAPEVRRTAVLIMYVSAIFLPPKVLNLHLVVGIFRSGGDTKFSLIFDVLGVWVIGVPLTILGGLVWGLPVPWIYFLAATEEIFKLFLGIPRLVSRKWINDLTRNGSAD